MSRPRRQGSSMTKGFISHFKKPRSMPDYCSISCTTFRLINRRVRSRYGTVSEHSPNPLNDYKCRQPENGIPSLLPNQRQILAYTEILLLIAPTNSESLRIARIIAVFEKSKDSEGLSHAGLDRFAEVAASK